MKIKHLLLGMLAMAAAVACKQDEPVEEPKLDVDKTAVTLQATAGEATFAVTSNQNWVASADADWVSLDPSSGAASEKSVAVKVTAEDNTTTEARTATVTVKAGALTKTVAVTQAAGAGETPGPGDEPELPVSDWAIVGSFTGEGWGWDPAAGLSLYVLDENYFVLYGLELAEGAQWKFLQGGAWGGPEVGADRTSVEPNTIQAKGGTNIYVTTPGKYDIYLAADATKYYVMSEGKTPAEATEPSAAEKTYTVTGTIKDSNWDNMGAAGLMTKEGDYYVAKNVPFVTAKELYGGADQLEFKVCNTGSWDGAYGLTADAASLLNAEITVTAGGEKNIAVAAVSGTYDVYFDEANAKVWVMEAGYKPGEKEPVDPAPTEPVTEGVIWENDGTVGAATWSANPYRFSIEGGDSQKECVAEIPANIWAGMKIAPFCVNVKYAPEATWWQIRVLDGWWTANDESGASDVTPQTAGVVDNGDGTFTFQVDLTKNPDLATLIDTQHLLFAGEGFIINKIYFGDLPTPGEPEQPELQKSEWALVGSFNNWAPTSDIYLSVLDENYFVYYGFDMPAGGEFKFLKGGVWPPDGQEVGGNGLVQPNTIQAAGGSNIKVNEAGKYDIYLAADLKKFYIMSEGKLPSEATEPAPVEKTWGMMGCFVDNQWSKDVPMTKEGEWIVAKGAQFTELTFKIRANESWADATNIGLAPGSAKGEINTKVAVVTAEYAKANLGGDAADIKLNGEAGTYDVYFSYDNLELYVMTPGYMPGETPKPEPTQDGTEANPYLVADAAALQGMGALLVADATTYFKLTSNIDLAGVEWTPIATTETVDEATVVKAIALDGANFTISNAKDALFSTLCGSVQNLTVDGAAINATNTVGVIANQVNDATIKNVEVKNSSIVSTAGEAGGVVGKLTKGTLENVQSACSVSGTQQLGGLVGVIYDGTIKNCVATGEVTGANYYIGGLVGYVKAGTIQNCSASGNVTSTSTAYSRIGGLVGQIDNATITSCHATGNVKGDGHYCGGLIGVCVTGKINVSQSYATGNIIMPSSVNKSGGAGLIGVIESGDVTVANCYATGDVTAHRWSAAFIGRVAAGTLSVTNCYSKSNCTFTQPANCGALTGELNAKATMTYSGVVVWNLSNLDLFIRPDVTTAPEGNYYGVEGTISAKAKEFNWDTAIWDLSADDPTLK